MALAIRLDRLLATGQIKYQAEIARTDGITRTRVTQIMNLTNLGPDIQKRHLERHFEIGPETPNERELREVSVPLTWILKRKRWNDLVSKHV